MPSFRSLFATGPVRTLMTLAALCTAALVLVVEPGQKVEF